MLKVVINMRQGKVHLYKDEYHTMCGIIIYTKKKEEGVEVKVPAPNVLNKVDYMNISLKEFFAESNVCMACQTLLHHKIEKCEFDEYDGCFKNGIEPYDPPVNQRNIIKGGDWRKIYNK